MVFWFVGVSSLGFAVALPGRGATELGVSAIQVLFSSVSKRRQERKCLFSTGEKSKVVFETDRRRTERLPSGPVRNLTRADL